MDNAKKNAGRKLREARANAVGSANKNPTQIGDCSPAPPIPGPGLTPEQRAEVDKVRWEQFSLPPRTADSNEKTVGILIIKDKKIPLISGEKFPRTTGEPLPSTTSTKRPQGIGSGFTVFNWTHTEAHAASIMHDDDIKEAILWIDNPPCDKCNMNLWRMLPRGSTLIVVDPECSFPYKGGVRWRR